MTLKLYADIRRLDGNSKLFVVMNTSSYSWNGNISKIFLYMLIKTRPKKIKRPYQEGKMSFS
jgi:hypothetical protein